MTSDRTLKWVGTQIAASPAASCVSTHQWSLPFKIWTFCRLIASALSSIYEFFRGLQSHAKFLLHVAYGRIASVLRVLFSSWGVCGKQSIFQISICGATLTTPNIRSSFALLIWHISCATKTFWNLFKSLELVSLFHNFVASRNTPSTSFWRGHPQK